MGTISKITGIAIASVSKLGGIAVASISKMAGQVKAAAAASAATGPIPYSKSMYLDGSNDELRSYGNNALGSGGYENSIDDMENFAAPILDVTSPFSFDLEFRGHSGYSGTLFRTWCGNFNMSTNGGFYWQCVTWGDNCYVQWYWYRKTDAAGGGTTSGGYLYGTHYFSGVHTNHLAGQTTMKGTWHKFTVCKGSGSSLNIDNWKIYMNGYEAWDNGGWGTSGSSGAPWDFSSSFGPLSNATWITGSNNQGYRWFDWVDAGADITVGSISWYNKMLTVAEVNDLYDGGARLSGTASQAAIMNIDPTTAATSDNLLHYYYLTGSRDTGSVFIHDKIAGGVDPVIRVVNAEIGNISSAALPHVPLFEGITAPTANYTGESISFTQAGSTGSSTVAWYSDASRETLLTSSNRYELTVPSGSNEGTSYSLYTKDTNGSIVQTGQVDYLAYATPGYEDYSYDFAYNNGSISYLTQAAASAIPSSSFVNGCHSATIWYMTSAAFKFNGGMVFCQSDSRNDMRVHGNASRPTLYFKIDNVTTYHYFSNHFWPTTWDHGEWRCLTYSHDPRSGSLKVWTEGKDAGTMYDAAMSASMIPDGTSFKMYMSPYFGKIAQIGIYNDVLTDAEAFAIQGGISASGVPSHTGGPGNSQDLQALAGSKDKLLEYWKFEEEHDNDNADRLTSTGSNEGYFVLATGYADNSARRNVDRP